MGRRAKTAEPGKSRSKRSKQKSGRSSSRNGRSSPKKGSHGAGHPPRPSTTDHASTGGDESARRKQQEVGGASEELSRIQLQTGVFQRKTFRDRGKIEKLDALIKATKGKIMSYRRNMGGETALTNNDRFVKHQISIMETRVKNAAVEYMRACEHNRQLRMTVNDERRYRMIQLEVQRRIEADLATVDARNNRLRSEMNQTQRELQKVKVQMESHRAWFRQQEEKQEERWRELDQDPDDINLNVLTETRGTTLPRVGRPGSRGASRGGFGDDEPEMDRVGNMTLRQENRMKTRLVSSKWESAFLTTEEGLLAEKLQRYRTMFAEVKKALGVADLDEFNETFSAREDQNFAIVQHINQLNEEAAQLEEEIDRVKTKATDIVETCATDNRPRKKISEQLQKKLHGTVAKYLWYEERLTNLMGVAKTFRRGIGNLYAFLHGINKSSNEDIPGLTELNMIKYLGSVENEVFTLLKRFLKQHAFPGNRPSSRSNSARSPSTPGRAHTADGARRLPSTESPRFSASAKLLQGPSESTGKLSHLQVVAPTVATVSALAATANLDDTVSLSDDPLDGGPDVLKPLSLDALRRSAMSMQAVGESLSRVATLESLKSSASDRGDRSSKHKRVRAASPLAIDSSKKNGQLSSTIPALQIGGSSRSTRRRKEHARSNKLNKTTG